MSRSYVRRLSKIIQSSLLIIVIALAQVAAAVTPFIKPATVSAGNNGTLKVHDLSSPSGTESNEPKVCKFDFEGFEFDEGQEGLIKIEPQSPPTTDTLEIPFGPADVSGYYKTVDVNNGGLSLDDGHYKSTLYGKDKDGEYTIDLKAKSKVFKVNCNSAQVEVRKVVNPVSDSGKFNLLVNGVQHATNVGNGGTTGDVIVDPTKNVTVSESQGDFTLLSNYDKTIECRDEDGNGSVVASSSTHTATIDKKDIDESDNVLCIITNTRKETNNGSITIIKDVSFGQHHRDFDFKAEGTGVSDFTLDDDDDPKWEDRITFDSLSAGSYSFTEVSPTSWFVEKIDCGENTPGIVPIGTNGVKVTLTPGQKVTCRFVNMHDTGSVVVRKKVDMGNGFVSVGAESPFKWGIDSEEATLNMGEPKTGVPTGTHQVFENEVPGYEQVGWYIGEGSCTNKNLNTTKVSVSVVKDTLTSVTFCNKLIRDGSISGYKFQDLNKNGTKDGIFESKIGNWKITLKDSQNNVVGTPTYTNNNLFSSQYGNYSFNNLPYGTYYVCEEHPIGWQMTTPNIDEYGCVKVVVDSENKNKVVNFGNLATAKITVIKNVDENGDGEIEEDEENVSDWSWNYFSLLDWKIGVQTGATETVRTGSLGTFYLLNENQQDGYDLTDVDCNEHFWRLGDKVKVYANVGDDIVCTFTNTKRAKVIIKKEANPRDGTDFHFKLSKHNPNQNNLPAFDSRFIPNFWQHHDKHFTLDNVEPDDQDNYTNKEYLSLKTGETYYITEKYEKGWDLKSIYCYGAEWYRDGNTLVLYVQDASKVYCKFVNEKRGKVVVTKFNDLNTNGYMDEGEEALPGWDMTLSGKDECYEDLFLVQTENSENGNYDNCEEYDYDKTQTTGDDGTTTFKKVKPYKWHYLSETVQEGWSWSNTYCDYENEQSEGYAEKDNYYRLYVSPGETLNCYVGNIADATLNLTKSNNKPNPTVTGDTVTYTLVASLDETSGALFDVKVVDLPPAGFVYVPGSWTANSNFRGNLVPEITPEPTYSSPGTWNLGNMLPGEIVTLTYLAKIASTVTNGTYPDIAFASGCAQNVSNADCASLVYSNVHKVSTPFVDTKVTVATPQVLAANVLVNTGTPINFAYNITAALLMLIGIATAKRRNPLKGGAK